MTFQDAEQIFFNSLPAFSNIGKKAIKPGLDNITALCHFLNNPQNQFKSIHIAGTNGKGSTSHILAAVLQSNGYKTGLYTSPHLVTLRERCKINGQLISEELFVEFTDKVQPILSEVSPSYFELNVALAFYAFAAEKVDVAIIETGLGGRLDSTNIIMPELSIITHIALEHTDILGDTLEKIAIEKAGIIKPRIPVVIGKTQAETERIFIQKALASQSPILFADQLLNVVGIPNKHTATHKTYECINHANHQSFRFQTDLMGDYQRQNLTTAFAAIEVLRQLDWNIAQDKTVAALGQVCTTTGLKGRWDYFSPDIILDVAHNPDGMREVAENIAQLNTPIHIVFGAASDKDTGAVLKFLPEQAVYYLCQAQVLRAKPVQDLAEEFKQSSRKHFTFETVEEAVKNALSNRKPGEYVLILGSFFVVGEAYKYLDSLKGQNK